MVCKNTSIYGFLGPWWVLTTYNVCPPGTNLCPKRDCGPNSGVESGVGYRYWFDIDIGMESDTISINNNDYLLIVDMYDFDIM